MFHTMIDSCGIFLTGSSWHTRFLAYWMKNKVFDEESKPSGEKWTVRTVPLILFLAYWMKNMVFDEESKPIGEKWTVRTVPLIRSS